jgi:predicted aldo/keto reductase-like oxidoreductase
MTSRRAFCLTGIAGPAAAQLAGTKSTTPALRYRTLGRTGLKVTELGCGCEAVSDPTVLERAADLGINFFDTARSYQGGNNERSLRPTVLKRRKQMIIASRSYGASAREIQAHLDESLHEIGVDYLDIWYIGAKDEPAQVTDDMLDVQAKAQKAGKIRFRGISTHRLHRLMPLITGKGNFDVVQIPYNFAIGTRRDTMNMDGTNLYQCLDALKKANIGVVAMKVMAGAYRGRTPSDPLYDVYQKPNAHASAIRWALRDDRVQTTSVRMSDHEMLDENVRAMSAPFSAADEKVLAAYADAVRPVYCRMCGSCDGSCPNGVRVADVVRSVMYVDGYGHFGMGLERFDRASAAPCPRCPGCTIECPNGVQIPKQIVRARELFT